MTLTRSRRNTVAFVWTATAFAALASLIVLLFLSMERTTYQLAPIPKYLYAQTDGSLSFRLSYVALAASGLAQVILLWTTNLGRHRWIIPVGVEVVVCVVFSLASYRLLRGYEAVGACTGRQNCVLTYPSPLIAAVSGLVVGVVLGFAWRLSWEADERQLRQSHASRGLYTVEFTLGISIPSVPLSRRRHCSGTIPKGS